MTEQKAIEVIKYASAFNSDNSPLTEALDMAIKALEKTQQAAGATSTKRDPIIHELKIIPKYYNAVQCGIKNFELRKDDRDYQVGDWLILREWKDGEYTGKVTGREIQYILRDAQEYGLEKGYCIIGLQKRT